MPGLDKAQENGLRVLLALAALVAAKVASVYIPVFCGRAVDVLSPAIVGALAGAAASPKRRSP